jgi:citrate lyase beta subunit
MVSKQYNFWLLTETPAGVAFVQNTTAPAQLSPLLSGSRLRIRGLIFGAEDYAKTMGITRSPSLIEMLLARQSLVRAAKARPQRLEVLDLVSSSNPSN